MRATRHNGRGYSAKHNDRDFDVKEAPHIAPEKAELNYLWNCYSDPTLTFEQVELKFYKETFGHQLEVTNKKYIEQYHPERVKSMETWMKSNRHCPEESIMQIGNMEDNVDRQVFIDCFNDFHGRLEQWNVDHGKPFTTLTNSIHADETGAVHSHTRRVWHYEAADGLRIGQEKALTAAGVELPDDKKSEGRNNNRKMTFDAMCRELWLDVLHEHGLEIEREPVPDGKHNMTKEQMIREKYKAMIEKTEVAEAQVVMAEQTATGILEQITETGAELAEARQELQETQEEAENVYKEVYTLSGQKEALEGQISTLEGEKERLVSELQPYRDLQIDITGIDEIEVKPVLLKPGMVMLKEDSLSKLQEQAKAYVVNRDRIENIDIRRTEVNDREQLVKRREESQKIAASRLAAREAEVAQAEARQANLNQLLRDAEQENATLKKQNASLTAENGSLRAELSSVKESLGRQIESLKSKLQSAYDAIRNVVKAIGLFNHSKSKYYGADLTDDQKRLVDGVANYASDRARETGFDDIATDIDRHVGIEDDLIDYVKPEQRQKGHDHSAPGR